MKKRRENIIQEIYCDVVKKNKCDVKKELGYERKLDYIAAEKILSQPGHFELLIGDELNLKSSDIFKYVKGKSKEYFANESARYFRIFYTEERSDVFFVQFTPTACFKSGYLKVDKDGNFSITDDDLSPYDAGIKVYNDSFVSKEQHSLRVRINSDIVLKERTTSKCVKTGLAVLGIFAVAAVGVLAASSNTNGPRFTP